MKRPSKAAPALALALALTLALAGCHTDVPGASAPAGPPAGEVRLTPEQRRHIRTERVAFADSKARISRS